MRKESDLKKFEFNDLESEIHFFIILIFSIEKID